MTESVSTAQESAVTSEGSTGDPMESFVSVVTDALAESGADRETIESVETHGSRMVEHVEQLESDNEQLSERVEQLESELADARETRAQEDAEIRGRLHQVEQCKSMEGGENGTEETYSEDETPTPSVSETTPQRAVTPLERVTRMDESTAGLSRNQVRAKSVFEDVLSCTQSVPKGRAISTPNLKRVLTGIKESGSAYYKDVSRVVDFLTKMGRDHVWTKQRMNGDTVVVFSEEICKRRAAYQNQASAADSVVSGGRVAD